MTTLVKTFALAGLLLTSSINLFASDDKGLNKSIVENVVDAYIDGTVKGETTHLKELFADNFTQRYQTGAKQEPIGKNAYVKFLRGQKGIQYNCETSYEIIESTREYSMAKVTLDFEKFTRTDYVTMEAGKEGWAIKEVNSVYKNK